MQTSTKAAVSATLQNDHADASHPTKYFAQLVKRRRVRSLMHNMFL